MSSDAFESVMFTCGRGTVVGYSVALQMCPTQSGFIALDLKGAPRDDGSAKLLALWPSTERVVCPRTR